MNNRALEFLREADRIMANLSYTNKNTAQTLIRLAMGEVGELLDRIAALETQHVSPPHSNDGPAVLIAEAMTPARLEESSRALRALEWLDRRARAALPEGNR